MDLARCSATIQASYEILMNHLIGIAGGSGAGKSTLAYGLQARYPDRIEVVHFDDYQKYQADVPVMLGMKNWDHPDAIDFEKLYQDLCLLQKGEDVEVLTKSAKHNPTYEETGRLAITMQAKPLIVVEGYMALTNENIRKLYAMSVFLDLHSDERINRRTKFIDPEYTEQILIPMHETYVEPTKAHADVCVDVAQYSDSAVQDLVVHELQQRGLL